MCHITVLRRKAQPGHPAEYTSTRREAATSNDVDVDEIVSGRTVVVKRLAGEEKEEKVSAAVAVAASDSPEREDLEDGELVPLGRLALVDLAGSERNYETLKMSVAQHKESGGDVHSTLYHS